MSRYPYTVALIVLCVVVAVVGVTVWHVQSNACATKGGELHRFGVYTRLCVSPDGRILR